MQVARSRTIPDFMAQAREFLAAREAENNLIFGILSNLEADPSQFAGPPYLATVLDDGDRVIGAAIRTPPWRLVISELDDPAAADALAGDLASDPAATDLPGVVGPAGAAGRFARAWGARTGVPVRLGRHERNFRLEQVIPPRPATGRLVRARAEDHAVLAAWSKAFHEEALPGGPAQDYEANADRWIRGVGRTGYLWLDDDQPVSLAGAGGLTPTGIRIGPVYTPPELRGRGYASNLVAGVSQMLLDAGRRFVFLFTDLANPTANKIYQAIGYEAVNDVDEYEFG